MAGQGSKSESTALRVIADCEGCGCPSVDRHDWSGDCVKVKLAGCTDVDFKSQTVSSGFSPTSGHSRIVG